MTKKTVTLHMYIGTESYNRGAHDISMHDFRQTANCMTDKIWLGATEVEIDFPEVDMAAKQVEALQKKHAAAQKAADEIGAQISGLLEAGE